MGDPDLDDLAQATGLVLSLVGALLEGAEVLPPGGVRPAPGQSGGGHA